MASSKLVHKTMRLQSQTVSDIQATAKNLGTNFNRTVELLLQLGLQYTHKHTSELDFELQRVVVDQGVCRALNRYLKLLSQTTLAANEAKEMAQQVFFRQLCQLGETVTDPDEIYSTLALYPDDDPLHAALFAVYTERQERSAARAADRLTHTIAIDQSLWDAATAWDTGTSTPTVVTEAQQDISEAEAQAPELDAMRCAVEQSVSRLMNRYLKLLIRTLLAAVEAKEMAQQVLFMQLCQLAARLERPEDAAPSLSLDTDDPLGSALYELYIQRQKRSRNRAVRQLKRVIAIDDVAWQTILAQLDAKESQ